MSGAMNRHCSSRINYVHSPDGELLCGVSGNTKTMHTGLARNVLHYANPGADTEETDVKI